MTLQPSFQPEHALDILMGGYPKVKPREQPMHIKPGPTEDRAKDHRSRRLGIDAVPYFVLEACCGCDRRGAIVSGQAQH